MTIVTLMRRLDQSVERLRQHPPAIGQPELMVKAAERLLRGRANPNAAQARTDRVRRALADFLRMRTIDGNLRHLCWGLMEPFPREPLLRRPECRDLLSRIERAFADEALTAGSWRGLLQAYFTATAADIDGPGADNWRVLRTFLARTLPALCQRMRFHPPWLTALWEQANLLEENPCAPYAAPLLAGDRTSLDRLRTDIGVPSHSWFWRETVLAQVKAACSQSDSAFAGVLEHVIGALREHSTLINDGLILLLPRYFKVAAETPHDGLRDLAVTHWGSPNIFAQAKWAQVSPPVKDMVQAWLAREDLQTFFEILQADRTVDRRRFDFWLRYHRQMDFVRIALGSQAWHATSPDLRKLRESRKGRVGRLDGGAANLNAIIMKIGEFIFVEFSHTGNAAYGYAQIKLPFELRDSVISRASLSDPATAVFRQSHMDGHDRWEEKYARTLSSELGIRPDGERFSQIERPTLSILPAQTQPAIRPVPPSPLTVRQPAATRSLDIGWVREECRRRAIRFVDNRPKHGAFWVHHHDENDGFARDLAAMGFRHSAGNGWWRT